MDVNCRLREVIKLITKKNHPSVQGSLCAEIFRFWVKTGENTDRPSQNQPAANRTQLVPRSQDASDIKPGSDCKSGSPWDGNVRLFSI